MNAQTNETDARRWLAHAEVAPRFIVPDSKVAWEQERKRVRAELWELLGKLPPRPKLPQVETLSREDRGNFVVEKFQFDNLAGATVPGYVVLPKQLSGKAPAILFCHWHGGDYDLGKEALFQAHYTPGPFAPTFARRGFIVTAIDAYCFGERNGKGPGGPEEKGREGEWSASKFNLWLGRSLWGMMLRDDLMALDYLASRPEVDARRIGATGMSMGATRTWWLMALDDRIRTGVAVACLTRYQNLIQREELKKHGIYYFVPNLLNHYDTESVVALIAPRPILFLTGDQDAGSPTDGIHTIESAVRPVYGLYGKADDLESVIYPGVAHVYTPDMWARTLSWMDKYLKQASAH